MEKKLRGIQTNVRISVICVIGISDEEKKENGDIQKIFDKIRAKAFTKLMKDRKLET